MQFPVENSNFCMILIASMPILEPISRSRVRGIKFRLLGPSPTFPKFERRTVPIIANSMVLTGSDFTCKNLEIPSQVSP